MSASLRRPSVRSWFVIPVSLLLLAAVLPAATLGVRAGGTLGLRLDRWTGAILAVAPGSPAAGARIVPGETIVPSSLPPTERIRLLAPPPGMTFSFDVSGARGAHRVTLRAAYARSPYSPLDALMIAAEVLTSAAFILIGTALFVLRPGWMTFWLYVYCAGTVPLDALEPYYTALPDRWLVVWYVAARTFFSGFSALPLLPFVLLFPSGTPSGWQRRALPPAIGVVAVGFCYYAVLAVMLVRSFVPAYRLLDDMPNRQRLKIAIWGMALAFIVLSFDYLPGLPEAIYPLTNSAALVMPVAIGYAVFKYRVFDVNYFVNRAVVFAVFTSGLVVAVGFLEWFTGGLIEEQHLARAVTAAASIAIGVLLDKVHARAERFLERLVFRKRFKAASYLQRIARALVEAESVQTVHEALAREPCDELELTSAAVFAYDQRGRTYRRVYAVGWDDRSALELAPEDLVPRVLRADLETLRLGDVRWHRADLPPEPRTPVIAVPVALGRELLGFTLYGPHANATDVDPDEAEILKGLAGAAAVAYTRILALDSQRELLALRAKAGPAAMRSG
jgi:hypothetical protein